MKKENNKTLLIKPKFYNKNDPKNPKNIDAEKFLATARQKKVEEISNKKIIIDGKENY